MGVRVGSARSNENGGVNGGKAGDQTGREVSTQPWYLHSKGWIVIRAKSPAVREAIAKNMEAACQNNNIGYCQGHRGTATAAAKPYTYDLSKVNTVVETDCSELVRCCLQCRWSTSRSRMPISGRKPGGWERNFFELDPFPEPDRKSVV